MQRPDLPIQDLPSRDLPTVIAEVAKVYEGSNGDATKALYFRLVQLGPVGDVAVNLFRATKSSERAKVYRRGGHRGAAYDRKNWSLENLTVVLGLRAGELGIVWGWGEDPKQEFHRHVLYVDLPTGQVSFHAAARGAGPDYPGAWDGVKGAGPQRVIRFAASLLAASATGETLARVA